MSFPVPQYLIDAAGLADEKYDGAPSSYTMRAATPSQPPNSYGDEWHSLGTQQKWGVGVGAAVAASLATAAISHLMGKKKTRQKKKKNCRRGITNQKTKKSTTGGFLRRIESHNSTTFRKRKHPRL